MYIFCTPTNNCINLFMYIKSQVFSYTGFPTEITMLLTYLSETIRKRRMVSGPQPADLSMKHNLNLKKLRNTWSTIRYRGVVALWLADYGSPYFQYVSISSFI